MPRNKSELFMCPSCGIETRQTLRDNGLATCNKCHHSHLYNPNKKVKSITDDNDFSDLDDVSVHSDDYVPVSDNDSSDEESISEKKTTRAADTIAYPEFDLNFDESIQSQDMTETANTDLKLQFNDTDEDAGADEVDSDSSEDSFDRKIALYTKRKPKNSLKSLISELEGDLEKSLKTPNGTSDIPSIFKDIDTKKAGSASSARDTKKNDYAVAFSDSDLEDDHNIAARPVKRPRHSVKVKKRTRRDSGDSYSESEVEDSAEEKSEIEIYTPNASKSTVKGLSVSEKPTNKYNPYIAFNKLVRKDMSARFPNASNAELSKKVSEAWKSLSADEKEKFIAEYKAKRDQMHAINNATKPKKVPAGNGYLLFSKEELAKVRKLYPDVNNINELSAIVGVRWKNLEQEERDAYHAQAKKEREAWIAKYPLEFEEHQKRMADRIRKTRAANRKAKKAKKE